MHLANPKESYKFLGKIGASSRLIRHVKLVGEAADELLLFFEGYGAKIDKEFVRVGVAIHDAGKINYPAELDKPGNEHEPAGERLLLQHGVDKSIARCCLSHARFAEMKCSTEELLIALSDKLWKGKRVEALEAEVIDRIANSLGQDRWDIFIEFDSCFESVAARGPERLSRS